MSRVASPEIRRHRLTVEDYHRMGEAGILSEDTRVELIEGDLVDMAPIGSRHAGTVSALNDVLAMALHGRAIVAVQSPVTLSDQSEPQPDVAILKFREDYYRSAHPGPADVLLLIEVADTSAAYDRGIKVDLYARHGIPEAWLVDLLTMRLEVYHGPEAGEYRHVDYYRSGTVSPKAFSDLAVNLRALGFAGG